MLDNFIDYYNDPTSVFASDQKAAVNAVSGVTAEAVSDKAEGYFISPISGKRINEPVEFCAKVANANGAKVQFKLNGAGQSVTLDGAADGAYYRARLDKAQLESLGHSADGTADLIVNGDVQQTINLLYNIEEKKTADNIIDDFDGYYMVDGLLNKAWTINSPLNNDVSLTLDGGVKYNGEASLKFVYNIIAGGYAGAEISKDVDWSKYDALQLWTVPDGKRQKTVIQISANGQVYEAYLNEYAEYANTSSPLLVTIPFTEFVNRDAAGQPKGGLKDDRSKITGCAIYVNAIDNDAMVNGKVSGSVYYDNIAAIENGSSEVTIVKAEGGSFDDVPMSAWYYGDVEYAAANGIMNGTGYRIFEPETAMTRAMFAQVLYNMEGRPAAQKAAFGDVAADVWYADAVGWAAASGIISGYDSATFGSEDSVTREQAAAMLYRYAAVKGYNTEKRADLSGFNDSGAISPWAAEAMQWANAEGLINGVSGEEIAPADSAVRAQLAAILRRYCEKIR